MKINDWLKAATLVLERVDVGSARLDCLILLEDVTGKDRSWVLAHLEFQLSSSEVKRLQSLLKLRQKHLPLSYIRGKTEFYGREFIINKNVLEPRPESETIISLLCKLAESSKLKAQSLTIADVGTGSGALAISAKLELPKLQVLASDIDKKCLQVARENARKHNVNIKCMQGDLLEPFKNYEVDIVLANLPYVPLAHEINRAALNEPKIAIFGGLDGLDVYRRLFTQLHARKSQTSWVLCESLPPQHDSLSKIARDNGYKLVKTNDFIQLYRKA